MSPYALDDTALDSLLMRHSRPEVPLYSNNHLALHCLQHIHRLGMKVPWDIALLTSDNYLFSMLTDLTITAVEVDIHDMGINAVRLSSGGFANQICKHDPTTHRPVFLNEKQHNGIKTTIRPASLAMQGGLLICG